MVASPVVSLKATKPKADGPTNHFVRLSRGEDGCGFTVSYVDGNGLEDFRSQRDFNTYDEALKDAQSRAHEVRRPLKDDTGVEAPAEPKPQARQTKAQTSKSAGDWAAYKKSAKAEDQPELTITDVFSLPEITKRLDTRDWEALGEQSERQFRELRGECAVAQDEIHGAARNHTVVYSQRTHDIVQKQIAAAHHKMTGMKMLLLTFLELAFERIEALESTAKGMRYRAVFKQGEHYEPGDVCTWGGSAWHCNEPTTEKPDTGPWQLMVKKGRDGKDAR